MEVALAETDDKKVGGIILRDLELFNRAAVFMEKKIAPLARKEVGQAVKEWTQACDWEGGGYNEQDYDDLWVAPREWHMGDDWVAWFSLQWRGEEGSDSYPLADLFGVGRTDFGIKFLVDHGRFGGRVSWNNHIKTLASDIGFRLGEQGWVHEGKGVFFHAVKLPADLLADAWENEDWVAALEPLEHILDALKDDVPIFDDLIGGGLPVDA